MTEEWSPTSSARARGLHPPRAARATFLRRHCEPTGRREAPPDDRLREAIQWAAKKDQCRPREGGDPYIPTLLIRARGNPQSFRRAPEVMGPRLRGDDAGLLRRYA